MLLPPRHNWGDRWALAFIIPEVVVVAGDGARRHQVMVAVTVFVICTVDGCRCR